MKYPKILALVLTFLLTGQLNFAENKITALMNEPSQEIILDGQLSEPIWKKSVKFENFKTFEPNYFKEPAEKTIAYIAYDANYLYFAMECFDKDPSKIKASLTKRDNMFNDDWVAISLDTFNDCQGSYAFFVNPLGIQGDGRLNNQGNFNPNQDLIWDSKGKIDDKGYTVELKIPLKSLRFPNKKEVTFRITFFRQLSRQSEMASSPVLDPEQGGIIKQARPVIFTGLKYKRVIEILPAFTYINTREIDEDKFELTQNDPELGLTAKVGITSDLVLDATINPDFSQVESDAGQVDVNLRYALFYPEKRPFFLEGSELFQIAGNMEEGPLRSIVHTRNIINPIFGLKLTGKIGRKNSIELLHAKDKYQEDEEIIKPDFTIFRYKRSLKDDSYIGGFATRKWQDENDYNYILGTDGFIRLNGKSTIGYHLVGSFFKDTDTLENKSTHALGVHYGYGDKNFIFDIGMQDISEDFKVDTGYISRTGITRLALFGMYRFYPKSTKFFKRIESYYWSFHLYDKDSNLFETFNLFTLRFQLPASTQIRFDGILGTEVFSKHKFKRNAIRFQANSKPSKKLVFGLFLSDGGKTYYDEDDPCQGYGFIGSLYLQYQPFEQLDNELSYVYSDFYKQSNDENIYTYKIIRNKTTLQLNKYFYLRGIIEYNTYRKSLTADILASFTYIPGTVIYAGYGSMYQKIKWHIDDYIDADNFLEIKRGFFFKVSYLIRL